MYLYIANYRYVNGHRMQTRAADTSLEGERLGNAKLESRGHFPLRGGLMLDGRRSRHGFCEHVTWPRRDDRSSTCRGDPHRLADRLDHVCKLRPAPPASRLAARRDGLGRHCLYRRHPTLAGSAGLIVSSGQPFWWQQIVLGAVISTIGCLQHRKVTENRLELRDLS